MKPTPVDAVRHGLVILASAWQGLWILSQWLDVTTPLLLGITTLGWLAMLASIWLGSKRIQQVTIWCNISILALVAVLLIWGDFQEQGVGAITMLASLLGMLLATRVAAVLVVAVAIVELRALFGEGATLGASVLTASYALAVGLGALLARLALMRAARRAMDAQQAASDQTIRARALETVATELLAMERIVHATVLNTLTALGRGATSEPAVIRERAKEGAHVLRTMLSGEQLADAEGSLTSDLKRHRQHLESAGIAVEITEPRRFPPIPEPVNAAFRGAITEAVTNIERHSGATRVWIAMSSVSGGLRVVIRDDGRGIAPDASERIGLADIVFGALRQVGADVALESSAGGTQITMQWQPERGRSAGTQNVQWVLARFVTPFLAVFWSYAALRIVIGWDEVDRPALNLLAFAIFTVLVALLMVRTRRRALNTPTIVAVLLASPLVYQLQQISGSVGAEWSSESIAALFIVIIGAGPPWVWPVSVALWLLIQGDVLAELVAPGFAILIAIGVFAISFRRNATRYEDANQELLATRAQQAVSAARVATTKSRLDVLRGGGAVALLQSIADGDADPRSPQTRQQCIDEERLLRTVLRLDPSTSRLHEVACRLALLAYQRGVALDIDLSDTTVFDSRSTDVERILAVALDAAYTPGMCRLTTQKIDREWMLSFTVSAKKFDVQIPTDMTEAYIPADSMWLLEWRITDATGDR